MALKDRAKMDQIFNYNNVNNLNLNFEFENSLFDTNVTSSIALK